MEKPKILVIYDRLIDRETLEQILTKEGYKVTFVDSGIQALGELDKREFDLVLADLMQHTDGIQVLERTKNMYPDVEVIIITGCATVSSAVEAMQKGAYHYLAKPYNIDEFRMIVKKALEKRKLGEEISEQRRLVESRGNAFPLLGKSHKMMELKKTIEQIAPTDCNVVILGETGTGKELVAKLIHQLSPRAEKRFLAINCGAFSEELLSNELFGHEKEAFTGARGVKKGLLESAHGGTILLDEIGDMPFSMQVKLLRVIEERKLIRVGGTEEIPVDIRVLAATNKDLKREVGEGRFRQDLYYRLNVVSLFLPPLVERKEDIPLLANHFLRKFCDLQGKNIEKISDEVIQILTHYEFPGNVRELENIIERAVAIAQGPVIEVFHLPLDLQQHPHLIRRHRTREFLTLEENEREYIEWVLKQTKGNKTRAAKILGIDRVSLWRKLKRYKFYR